MLPPRFRCARRSRRCDVAILIAFPILVLCTSSNAEEPGSGQAVIVPDRHAMVSAYREASSRTPETVGDVAAVYHLALDLDHVLFVRFRREDGDVPPDLEAFLASDLGLPGLEPGCLAECSLPSLAVRTSYFAGLANATPEDADDRFFELLTEYYGPRIRLADRGPAEWPAYREQTWDYGGHSLLGSGVHLRLLSEVDRQLRVAEAFRHHLTQMREDLMRDLLETSDCAGLSSPEILTEIANIVLSETLDLSAEERDALCARREEFEDPAVHGIEVACRTASCSCDSG